VKIHWSFRPPNSSPNLVFDTIFDATDTQ
jgi:hypothetical protein